MLICLYICIYIYIRKGYFKLINYLLELILFNKKQVIYPDFNSLYQLDLQNILEILSKDTEKLVSKNKSSKITKKHTLLHSLSDSQINEISEKIENIEDQITKATQLEEDFLQTSFNNIQEPALTSPLDINKTFKENEICTPSESIQDEICTPSEFIQDEICTQSESIQNKIYSPSESIQNEISHMENINQISIISELNQNELTIDILPNKKDLTQPTLPLSKIDSIMTPPPPPLPPLPPPLLPSSIKFKIFHFYYLNRFWCQTKCNLN